MRASGANTWSGGSRRWRASATATRVRRFRPSPSGAWWCWPCCCLLRARWFPCGGSGLGRSRRRSNRAPTGRRRRAPQDSGKNRRSGAPEALSMPPPVTGRQRRDGAKLRCYIDLRLRMRGLEPPRGCPHWLLKPARLPIPPHPLRIVTYLNLIARESTTRNPAGLTSRTGLSTERQCAQRQSRHSPAPAATSQPEPRAPRSPAPPKRRSPAGSQVP